MNSKESLLILKNGFFNSSSVFKTQDLFVIDLPFAWEGHSSHLISKSETLFTGHNTECIVVLVLIVFVVSEHLPREHTLVVLLGEYGVSADILKSVIAQSVTLS